MDCRPGLVPVKARRVRTAQFRGEALMRAYLNLLVDDDGFENDASPGFLVNPFTNEEMQLDRYYSLPGVAFEHNGLQHYQATQKYPDETELLKQQMRDHAKQLICANRGIHLVVVHIEDLSLEGMRQKLKGLCRYGTWLATKR